MDRQAEMEECDLKILAGIVSCAAVCLLSGGTACAICIAAAVGVVTEACAPIDSNFNRCAQRAENERIICELRADRLPPAPPDCPSLTADLWTPKGPAPTTDPVIDQLTDLRNQVLQAIDPFLASGTEPPEEVALQIFSLGEQMDSVAPGGADAYLRSSLRGIEALLPPIDADTITTRGNAPPYPVPYVAEIERDGTTLQLRDVTGPEGQYTPRKTPNLRYQVPRMGLNPIAEGHHDPDGDGLVDAVERVFGTDNVNPDTDGDGVSDAAEVDQGTNPLDGLPTRTGVIATADTPGTAVGVCAVDDVAAVADSQNGITVFNVFNGMTPVAVAQVDTPGTAQAVACAGDLVAVADGTAGLAVVEVGDPPAARLLHQVELGGAARAVAVAGDVAYGRGTLGVAGVVLVNGGEVDPGTSPGALSVTGNYSQSAAGAVNVEIGGLAAGSQHDQLRVSGLATLDGNLDVVLIDGFVPSLGDSFSVLTYGSRSGTFATLGGLDLGGVSASSRATR